MRAAKISKPRPAPGADDGVMDANLAAVADTALLVAAIRAHETTRDDRLFADPFAARLAGDRGRELLAGALAATGESATAQIVVRTRFWDDALLGAAQRISQVVILAAGMDARAYLLVWPDGTVVYELDQPRVLAAKDGVLAGERPACRRVAVGVDLAQDWPGALRRAGLDPSAPAVWLIEGLLQYLDEAAVTALFDRVDALSARGSVLLYDVVGKALLESEFMAPVLESMARSGAPWRFGTDHPGGLCERLGWSATVTDVAEPGNRYQRWYAPAVPMDVAGVPRGYFVQATKQAVGD
ncbi:SAM-dependent methyltransferase [Mycobacterium avium]|uniref:SAM-dependent methyltransferase n=1 Tax=Mycobacterium avium TaxID=1764 RepID=UPI0004AEBBA6|nr:SAM-dependent methyltransferase [Mycobacterium avium]MCA4759890.1 SAM-dependent methyltransferase [Mycobacterium avium subsp. hominissuis]MDO2354851.1 SAM-dependent methyltransferase [Mycobacterium avium subsp. hominissuis]